MKQLVICLFVCLFSLLPSQFFFLFCLFSVDLLAEMGEFAWIFCSLFNHQIPLACAVLLLVCLSLFSLRLECHFDDADARVCVCLLCGCVHDRLSLSLLFPLSFGPRLLLSLWWLWFSPSGCSSPRFLLALVIFLSLSLPCLLAALGNQPPFDSLFSAGYVSLYVCE